MPVEAIVRDIRLSAGEPFYAWRVPLEHSRPLLEPAKLFLRKLAPELFGFFRRALVKIAVALHSLNMRSLDKLRTRRIDHGICHAKNLTIPAEEIPTSGPLPNGRGSDSRTSEPRPSGSGRSVVPSPAGSS